jgi:hypothetical protein
MMNCASYDKYPTFLRLQEVQESQSTDPGVWNRRTYQKLCASERKMRTGSNLTNSENYHNLKKSRRRFTSLRSLMRLVNFLNDYSTYVRWKFAIIA